MFRRWRLKKAQARFLKSCRNLKEGRAYWDQAKGGIRIPEQIRELDALDLFYPQSRR